MASFEQLSMPNDTNIVAVIETVIEIPIEISIDIGIEMITETVTETVTKTVTQTPTVLITQARRPRPATPQARTEGFLVLATAAIVLGCAGYWLTAWLFSSTSDRDQDGDQGQEGVTVVRPNRGPMTRARYRRIASAYLCSFIAVCALVLMG